MAANIDIDAIFNQFVNSNPTAINLDGNTSRRLNYGVQKKLEAMGMKPNDPRLQDTYTEAEVERLLAEYEAKVAAFKRANADNDPAPGAPSFASCSIRSTTLHTPATSTNAPAPPRNVKWALDEYDIAFDENRLTAQMGWTRINTVHGRHDRSKPDSACSLVQLKKLVLEAGLNFARAKIVKTGAADALYNTIMAARNQVSRGV